ncbi:condensation domain-containing protein [Streptomyces sp. NPDC057638]|uniref:condensation domain-containing protein n=1 Tax=Streptomyces sp. NPDC057638 TaxID=3346190 RepID=UPI00369D7A92
MTTPPPPTGAAVIAPPSSGQRRLWFSRKLAPDSPAYVIQRALRVHGELDLGALRRSVDAVVRRHDALRTTYRETGAGLEQVVGDAVPEVFTVVPATAVGGTDADIDTWIGTSRARPFDLVGGPVLRFEALPLGDRDHLLLLTVHHIAFDGWSMRVFWRELALAYQAYREGTEPVLDPAPSHLEFTRRQSAAPGATPAALAHWESALANVAPTLDLPHDIPPGERSTGRAHAAGLTLPPETVTRLSALMRHHRSTAFVTLLAAYAALLCVCADTDEAVVATPASGRSGTDSDADLIGFLVDVVPLRLRCSGTDTLHDLLARTRETCLSAAENPVPYERVVALSRVPRRPHRIPLASAGFDLHPPAPLPALAGAEVTEWRVPPVTTRFEVELHLEHRRGESHGTLLVSADLFEADAADALAEMFVDLVTAWSAAPDTPLKSLDWNDEAENPCP